MRKICYKVWTNFGDLLENFKSFKENFESFEENFNKNLENFNENLKFFLLSILIFLALKIGVWWGGDVPSVSHGAATVYVTPKFRGARRIIEFCF